MASLFTRPRRFGKTLNMDMFRTFFEKTGEDTSVYFMDKKIWTYGKKYRDYQGKYPVIFITFKDVKRDIWEEAYDQISKLLRQQFERHSELLGSERCGKYEKEYFKTVMVEKADSTDMMMSLQRLSQMLGILIELKAARNFSEDKLKQLSETALAQIEDCKYDTDMIAKGVKTIFKYGVVFSGKQVEIAAASQ